MKTKFFAIALSVLCVPLAQAAALPLSDMEKYCLGPYCINDPVGKHTGKNPIFRKASKDQKKIEVPDCATGGALQQGYLIGVGDRKPESIVRFEPDPASAGKPASEYFRLVEVKTGYNDISEPEVRALAKKIVDRAGGKMVVEKIKYTAGSFEGKVAFESGDVLQLIISPGLATLTLDGSKGRGSAKQIQAQSGCRKDAPAL